jgi:DNA-binding transcriptional LysR family regulator
VCFSGSCRGRPEVPDDLLQHEAVLPVSIPLPAAALASAHLDTLLAAAVAGLGIAGLPSFVAAEALRDGRLERVLPAWRGITLSLHVAMPTRRHVPARTRAFVDFLVECFGGEDRDPWLDPPKRLPG